MDDDDDDDDPPCPTTLHPLCVLVDFGFRYLRPFAFHVSKLRRLRADFSQRVTFFETVRLSLDFHVQDTLRPLVRAADRSVPT